MLVAIDLEDESFVYLSNNRGWYSVPFDQWVPLGRSARALKLTRKVNFENNNDLPVMGPAYRVLQIEIT